MHFIQIFILNIFIDTIKEISSVKSQNKHQKSDCIKRTKYKNNKISKLDFIKLVSFKYYLFSVQYFRQLN